MSDLDARVNDGGVGAIDEQVLDGNGWKQSNSDDNRIGSTSSDGTKVSQRDVEGERRDCHVGRGHRQG